MSLLFLAMSFVASEVGILMWLCPIKGTGLVWFYFPSTCATSVRNQDK